MKRKLFAWLLALSMLVGLLPVTALPARAEEGDPDAAAPVAVEAAEEDLSAAPAPEAPAEEPEEVPADVLAPEAPARTPAVEAARPEDGAVCEPMETRDQTTYNISGGDVKINSSNVGTWNGRTITGTRTGDASSFNQGVNEQCGAIVIDGVSMNLTIRDLTVVADEGNTATKVSPILLANGAQLTLTLEGSNTLTACRGGAGICVPSGCTLTIEGSGSLNATGGNSGHSLSYNRMGGAGIGTADTVMTDSNDFVENGTIIINGGVITARGGSDSVGTGGAAGIGGAAFSKSGHIYINGGTVTATAGYWAAGIGGGCGGYSSVHINGGTVTANKSTGGSAIGCGYDSSTSGRPGTSSYIYINGGTVTANGNIGHPDSGSYSEEICVIALNNTSISCTDQVTGPYYDNLTFRFTLYNGAFSQGSSGSCNVRVGDGLFPAAGVNYTVGTKGKLVTAQFKRIVKYATASEESCSFVGYLNANGVTYASDSVTVARGTTSVVDLYSGYYLTFSGNVYDPDIPAGQTGSVSIQNLTLDSGSVTTTAGAATVSGSLFLDQDQTNDGSNYGAQLSVVVGGKTYSKNITFSRNGTHTKQCSFSIQEGGVLYVDLDGVEHFQSSNYRPLTDTDANTTQLGAGWYSLLPGATLTMNNNVSLNGEVNLVLTDGTTLTASNGITLTDGSSLTIWPQAAGTGKLIATGDSGIGGTGTNMYSPSAAITVNGGTVEANCTGGYQSSAIGDYYGSMSITINDGTVTANGGSNGYGICGNNGPITINGGTVTATPSTSYSAGIDSKHSITITGGSVTARGSSSGSAIGGRSPGPITISGGTVVAYSGDTGAGIGCNGDSYYNTLTITISGGSVIATAVNGAAIGTGARCGGQSCTINISGGTVYTHRGSNLGAAIGNGWCSTIPLTTTISYDSPASGPIVYADSYLFVNYQGTDTYHTVKLTKSFKDAETGTVYSQTDSADLAAIAGRTLVPVGTYGITVDEAITNGVVTVDTTRTIPGETITFTAVPDEGFRLVPDSLKAEYAVGGAVQTVVLTQDPEEPTRYSFVMPAADVTVKAAFFEAYDVIVEGVLHCSITASAELAEPGDAVTLTLAPDPYWVLMALMVNGEDVTASVSGNSYTFQMPAGNVSVSALLIPDASHFSQSGDVYTIHDAVGWDLFCQMLADGETFAGKTVVLDADVGTAEAPVTRMAGVIGDNAVAFQGVFNGGGHTLTFANTAVNDNYIAPFRYVGGSSAAHACVHDLKVVTTIRSTGYRHLCGLIALTKGYVDVYGCDAGIDISCEASTENSNLYPAGIVSQVSSDGSGTVTITGCTSTGTITSGGKYAGGLVGIVQGTATVENCLSSVVIRSTVDGDGTHGGLVAVTASNSTTAINGCVFRGKLLTVGENDTGNCGGILGWKNANVSITNCLYDPAPLAEGEREVVAGDGSYPSGTFYRGNAPTLTNCYYTRTLGTAQANQAWTLLAGDYVSVDYGTAANTYDVSELTAYANGLFRSGKFYCAEGTSLPLSYEPRTGYTFTGFQVNGSPLNGSTLTMPAENVTVTATFASLMPFEDVPDDAWYYDAVLWACCREPQQITTGTSATTFSPNQACTRAQIVTFLWRAEGSPEPTIPESPFTDVQDPDAYYYKAVLWAYENEITNGVGESSFGVNQGCSRAQVVTFLWRLAGSHEPESMDSPFDDVQDPNAWYYKAVLWAAENQITVGAAPNAFSPDKTCSRAQVVTFLYRYDTGNEATE